MFDEIILLELDCVTNPIKVRDNAFNSTYTFFIGVSDQLEIYFPTFYFKSSCDTAVSNPTQITYAEQRSNNTVIGVDCQPECTSDSKFDISLTAASDILLYTS